jgi:hypothetical protein
VLPVKGKTRHLSPISHISDFYFYSNEYWQYKTGLDIPISYSPFVSLQMEYIGHHEEREFISELTLCQKSHYAYGGFTANIESNFHQHIHTVHDNTTDSLIVVGVNFSCYPEILVSAV